MKNISSHLLVLLSPLAIVCSLTFFSCGSNAEKTADQAVEAMPTELKDTTVLKSEEENALGKLGSVIDTAAKK